MSASLPACFPAVRPTSSRRIGPVFAHNTDYQQANTDMFFKLRFIHYTMVIPFILLATAEVSINCMAYTYYITLMAKYVCSWLHHPLKLLTGTMFLPCMIQFRQDGFMLKLICMFLDSDLPIQLLLKSLSSEYNDRLVDGFHHIQNY